MLSLRHITHPAAIFACPAGRQRGLSVIVAIVIITCDV